MTSVLTAFGILCSVSQPLDKGRMVELKLQLAPGHNLEGEIYLRVPAAQAQRYPLDTIFAINFITMPK